MDAVNNLITDFKHHITDDNITGITYLNEYTGRVIIERKDETE